MALSQPIWFSGVTGKLSAKISKLSLNERERFIGFVHRVYPKRMNAEERFGWQIIENPCLPDKSSPFVYIATDKDNNIIGQFLLIPFNWYLNSREFNGFWGVDYFVEEEHRGAAGALLAMKAIRGNQPYFTIDPSEAAKQIASTLGAKTIGYLQRSIRFSSPLSRLKLTINNYLVSTPLKRAIPFHITRISKDHFPNLLSSGNQSQFELIDNIEEWTDYQWPDTMGFSRSLEFVDWRFFRSIKKYFFYRLNDSAKVYFVVRLAKWKGLKLLALVDYRMPHGDEKSWFAILEAAKKLAGFNRCDGIVTMHSHVFFEAALKKNCFHNNDKPLLIISSDKLLQPVSSDKEKNAIFATMADCDIDINFGT